MRRARQQRSLGFDPSSQDLLGPPTQAWLDQQAANHETLMDDRHRLLLGIARFQNTGWPALPEGPYPPAGDDADFPFTGDPTLRVSQSSVNQLALAEPGRITQGLLRSAQARRPKLNGLFWVGAASLGLAIYMMRK